MGQPKIESGGINEGSMQALVKYLPQYLQSVAGGIGPLEQAKLESAKATSPQQAQLEYDIYSRYAPQFAGVGSDIAAQNAQRQAASDLALARGAGGDIARQLATIQRELDPEYYKMRENAIAASNLLTGSLEDPNAPMSAAERSEVERSLARNNLARGTEAPTATSAVSDAMAFGRAGEERKTRKQQAIAQALGVTSGAAPAMQSRVDAGSATLGRGVTNFGEARLGNPNVPTGSDVMGAAGGLFSSFQNTGLQSALANQQRKTWLDKGNETLQSIGSVMSIGT